MNLPESLRALRHRNYRLFFTGQLISLTGTWMQSVAQAWLAYRLTDSAAMLGIVGFAGQIPALLFSPPAASSRTASPADGCCSRPRPARCCSLSRSLP